MELHEILYKLTVQELLKINTGDLDSTEEKLLTFRLLRTIAEPIQVSDYYEHSSREFREVLIFMLSPKFLRKQLVEVGVAPNIKWKFTIPLHNLKSSRIDRSVFESFFPLPNPELDPNYYLKTEQEQKKYKEYLLDFRRNARLDHEKKLYQWRSDNIINWIKAGVLEIIQADINEFSLEDLLSFVNHN